MVSIEYEMKIEHEQCRTFFNSNGYYVGACVY